MNRRLRTRGTGRRAAAALLRFAARNVLRNPRRSGLTVAAIAGGLFVLVFLKALADGYVEQRLDTGLGLTIGHVQVRPGSAPIGDPAAVMAALQGDPAVRAVAPRLRFTGYLKGPRNGTGVAGLGVDPARESAAMRLPGTIVAGTFLADATDDSPAPIVIGSGLGERLGLTLGDRAELMTEGVDGSLVSGDFEVTGVFRTGGALTDGSLVCVPLQAARALGLPDGGLSEVVAVLDDARAAPAVAARLATLPVLAGLDVASWEQSAPELQGALEMLRVMERVRTVVLFALVALAIFNTVTMSVFERRREFGVLMAMGMAPGAVFRLVVLEVVLLAAAGLALGTGLAAWVTVNWLGQQGVDFSALGARLPGALEGTGVVYPVLTSGNLFTAAGWVAAISLVVLALPGWRLLRADPAGALRALR